MNRRAFLSMIGLAAPTYFFAPKDGWYQPVPQPIITSYADYIGFGDLERGMISYDARFVANLKAQTPFVLMKITEPLPQVIVL